MNSIAGFIGLADDRNGSSFEDRLKYATALHGKRTRARRFGQAVFVSGAAAGEDHGIFPFADQSIFVGDAKLDNRAELGNALGMSSPQLAAAGDAELLWRMYQRWGEDGIGLCLGAFAFAHWDGRRLALARDCLGNRAMFFHRGRDFVAFATAQSVLFSLPDVPREIDRDVLADFMVVNLAEADRTFYRGIERVASRTLVEIDRHATKRRQYWAPDLGMHLDCKTPKNFVERARALFDTAVATATGNGDRAAISTSGGFDSSAIAATAARLGARADCYALVPPADLAVDRGPAWYMDDRAKIEALGRMHPTLTIHHCVEGAVHPWEQDDRLLFARSGNPLLGPANLGAFVQLYDAVRSSGHKRLLVGDYGNVGLSWAGTHVLSALLQGRQFAAFFHELRAIARHDDTSIARAAWRHLVSKIAPDAVIRLFQDARGHGATDVSRFSLLNPEYVAASGLARRWRTQAFDAWENVRGTDPVEFRTRLMFDHNQLARDFRSASQDVFGFEMRDPHADRRLLEFLLKVPEPLYRRDGVPRAFARAVLADRLPREILDERRHGAQGTTWFRRLDARRADIASEFERLEASPLASQMLDLPRLKRLLDTWPKDEGAAEARRREYRMALTRGIHVGRFIRWVEGGNG